MNPGSSTLKLPVLDDDRFDADRTIDPWDRSAETIDLDAVGHRVVHGGRELASATVVGDEISARLDALAPLAPLHQPGAVA